MRFLAVIVAEIQYNEWVRNTDQRMKQARCGIIGSSFSHYPISSQAGNDEGFSKSPQKPVRCRLGTSSSGGS